MSRLLGGREDVVGCWEGAGRSEDGLGWGMGGPGGLEQVCVQTLSSG